jgi:hypothetical protein
MAGPGGNSFSRLKLFLSALAVAMKLQRPRLVVAPGRSTKRSPNCSLSRSLYNYVALQRFPLDLKPSGIPDPRYSYAAIPFRYSFAYGLWLCH